MSIDKKCSVCVYCDRNSETEKVIKVIYGEAKAKFYKCTESLKEVRGESLCKNFALDETLIRYRPYQDAELDMRIEKTTRNIKPIFNTREEAEFFYKKSYQKANKKANKILDEIESLKEKYNFDIDYTFLGDTYGIYKDYQYISLNVDGISFKMTF